MKTKKLTKEITLERKVELLFTRPKSVFKICFSVTEFIGEIPSSLAMDVSDAKLVIEHIAGRTDKPREFESDIAVFEKLCEVIYAADDVDIELAAIMLTVPGEKEWFIAMLTDYYLENDMSRY